MYGLERGALAVAIVPISELALRKLTSLLRFEAQCCDRPCLETLQSDFFARFVAEAIRAFVNSGKRGVDLAKQLTLPVPRAKFQPEFGFLGCTIVRIGEICCLVLHMVDGAIDFKHEFLFPGAENRVKMFQLIGAHIILASAWLIRFDAMYRTG